MFAVVAAIFFGVSLILNVLDAGGDAYITLMLAGFLVLALHFVAPLPWRR